MNTTIKTETNRITKMVPPQKPTADGAPEKPAVLLFTAGVGEGSSEIRKRVCEKLKHLSLELDPAANETCKPDADISVPASKARILVIATREDLTIMRETRRLVASFVTQQFQAKAPPL